MLISSLTQGPPGIGADDVFVFLDAFHQSEDELKTVIAEPTLSQRMEYAALRASKAIFATSFTTGIAFFATAITPILPIHAFGIFAGLVRFSHAPHHRISLSLSPTPTPPFHTSRAKC